MIVVKELDSSKNNLFPEQVELLTLRKENQHFKWRSKF